MSKKSAKLAILWAYFKRRTEFSREYTYVCPVIDEIWDKTARV